MDDLIMNLMKTSGNQQKIKENLHSKCWMTGGYRFPKHFTTEIYTTEKAMWKYSHLFDYAFVNSYYKRYDIEHQFTFLLDYKNKLQAGNDFKE